MPLSPWVNPDDDHNGLFEKPVVVLFPNARSTSQGTFTEAEAYYNTPKFMRKVKTHAFAYFHKRTRAPLLACLSKQLHFVYKKRDGLFKTFVIFYYEKTSKLCQSPERKNREKIFRFCCIFLSFLLSWQILWRAASQYWVACEMTNIMSTFLVKHPVAYSAKCVSSETCWPVLYELHNCVIMAFQWVWCCSYSGIIPCKLNSRIVTRSFRTEKGDNLVVADCKSWASKEFSF